MTKQPIHMKHSICILLLYVASFRPFDKTIKMTTGFPSPKAILADEAKFNEMTAAAYAKAGGGDSVDKMAILEVRNSGCNSV